MVVTATTKPMSEGSGHRFAWWFGVALILSLAVHAFFLKKTATWKVGGFNAEEFDTIVPRTFHMKRVEIDQATLKEETKPLLSNRKDPDQIILPEEQPKGSEVAPPRNNVMLGTPSIGADLTVEELKQVSGLASGGSALNDLLHSEDRAMVPPGDPLEDLPSGEIKKGGANAAVPGFSTLDGLLEGKESLSTATAPILMPTDLLFEYDSATLRSEAEKSLEKLGTLVKRNAASRFRIEGHTDSFGSDDYNNALSLRRAEEVKRWLVSTMGIDAARITTAGMGRSRLIVPSTGSIAQQQLNRRVEIVITQGEKSP